MLKQVQHDTNWEWNVRGLTVASMVCALVAVACWPAGAALDILHGNAQEHRIQIGFYHPTGVGSMDDVREFDGRTLNLSSLEYLRSFGYSGPWQYNVLGRYLFAHDIDAAVDLAYRNRFGLSFTNSVLTHRLQAIRVGDISLVAPTPGVDDSPNQLFSVVRTVNAVGVRAVPDSYQALRLVAGSWMQSKDGARQQGGRWNDGSGTRKHVIAEPVHNDTTQATLGGDLRLGQAAVVNYRYDDTKFGEGGNLASGVALLNDMTRIDSDTKSSTFKARATINKRLYFTGVQITRKRENTRASFVESNPAGMTINSVNAALTYLATDALTFTARYRTLDQSSHVVPVISGGNVVNNALSTKQRSSLFEATYSGIPRAFMKLGYERRDVSRSTQFTSEQWAGTEGSTKANIVTGSIRYYPTTSLSLSANAQSYNADTAGFAGVPDQRNQVNANATYMLRDNFALFGDLSSVNERNSLIRVGWADIPVAATNATEEELRKEAAGQGYKNEMTTGTVGAWYAFNSRLVLDANYARISTDAVNLWILGVDPGYLPHTAPNMVPYKTENNQWSTGLTCYLTPKLRIYGRYILSKSDGGAQLNPTLYPPGVGPTWLPVDLRQHTYEVGFAHELSSRDRLLLDFSVSEYVDFLNSANTGTYSIWRVAWARTY